VDFEKVYVDEVFLRSLEKIAVEEGWFTEPEHPLILRNHLRKKTLLFLTLFDKIDSPSLLLIDSNLSRFEDEGIIGVGSRMLDTSRSVMETHKDMGDKSEFRDALKSLDQIALNILRFHKCRLCKYSINFCEMLSIDARRPVTVYDWCDSFEYMLSTPASEVLARKPHLSELKDDIDQYRFNLEQLLFMSMTENRIIASDLSCSAALCPDCNPDIHDDIFYLTRTLLTDEIVYLPNPHTLKDVLRMRGHPSIVRLREVIGEWCTYIGEGEHRLLEKARKDIKTANRGLKRLEKWREYKSSPLNFWFNAIGGQIPFLSNVLSVVSTLGGLYESNAHKKHNWTMIGHV